MTRAVGAPPTAGLVRGREFIMRRSPLFRLLAQGPGELLLFDPATNAPLRSIAVGKQPHWIAIANGGAQAVVTNEGSNDIAVVDLASGETRTIGQAAGGASGARSQCVFRRPR